MKVSELWTDAAGSLRYLFAVLSPFSGFLLRSFAFTTSSRKTDLFFTSVPHLPSPEGNIQVAHYFTATVSYRTNGAILSLSCPITFSRQQLVSLRRWTLLEYELPHDVKYWSLVVSFPLPLLILDTLTKGTLFFNP